jgi:hypothetical protein
MKRFIHWFHRDRHWQADGINAYYQCRCGAQRVRRLNEFKIGPVRAGWPPLQDQHGMPVTDTGWRKPRSRA